MDTTITPEHITAARSLQREYLAKFAVDHPTCVSARAALDLAERRRAAPDMNNNSCELEMMSSPNSAAASGNLNVITGASATPNTAASGVFSMDADSTKDELLARIAHRRARLTRNLKSINSNREHFYSHSVPTAEGEIAVRALVAADVTHPSNVIGAPKTVIEAQVRPLNAASFRNRRAEFLEPTEFPVDLNSRNKNNGKGKQQPEQQKNQEDEEDESVRDGVFHSGVAIHIKLKASATSTQKQEMLNFLRGIVAEDCDEDETHIDFHIAPAPEGAANPLEQRLIITFGNYEIGQDVTLLQEITHAVASAITDGMSDKPTEQEVISAAPKVFRHATARIEIPQSIGEWLQRNDAPAMMLAEGARCSVEIIAKDQAVEFGLPFVGQTFLQGVEADASIFRCVAALILPTLFKDFTLKLKVCPPELLFAMAIRGLGDAWRKAFRASGGEMRNDSSTRRRGHRSGDKQEDDEVNPETAKMEFLSTTAPENAFAALFAGKTGATLTSTELRRFFIGSFANDLISAGANKNSNKKLLKRVDTWLRLQHDIVAGLDSITMISQCGEVRLAIKGVDSKVWDWMPRSAQGIVDAAIPDILAVSMTKAELDELEKNSQQQQQLPDSKARVRLRFPRSGVFEEVYRRAAEIFEPVPLREPPNIRNPFQGFAAVLPTQRSEAAPEQYSATAAAWDFEPNEEEDQDDIVVDASRLLERMNKRFVEHVKEQFGVDVAELNKTNGNKKKSSSSNISNNPLATLGMVQQNMERTDERSGRIVKCSKCNEEHDANLPHECTRKEVTIVVDNSSRRRIAPSPPAATSSAADSSPSARRAGGAAVVEEKSEQIGRSNIITCSKCGEQYDAALPNSHGNKCVGPQQQQQQTVEMIMPSPPRVARPVNNGGRKSNNSNNSSSPPQQAASTSPRRFQPRKDERFFNRLGGTFKIPTDEKELRKLFDSFDQNGDGTISRAEFTEEIAEFDATMGLVSSSVAKQFARADTNHDGRLSFQEFSRYMLHRATE